MDKRKQVKYGRMGGKIGGPIGGKASGKRKSRGDSEYYRNLAILGARKRLARQEGKAV